MSAINYMNMESYLPDILSQINQEHHRYLRSLCFSLPFADDQMIEKIEKIFQV